MNAFSYLIQVNLYLLLFYAFYVAVLRNETFFKLNRIYLLGSALLSLCIPLIKTDWIKDLFITEKVQAFTQTVTYNIISPGIETLNTNPPMTQSHPWLTTAGWLWLIYGLVTLLFLLNFLWKLYKVSALFKTNIKGRAFSFFSKITVDDQLEDKETIINHEMVHARQWHSADVIFFEVLLAMNWFNPISYFYRNAIKNIHEFIADDSAASTLEDRSAYALLLVSNVFNTQPQQLTNSFFNQSLLKRRIIMLHKTKSRKVAILKYGLSVPLFAGMLIFSSATEAEAQITQVLIKVVPGTDGLIKINLLTNSNPLKQKPEITPTVAIEGKNTNNNIKSAEQLESKLIEFPANLGDYANNFKHKNDAFSEGLLFISFEVNENKKAGDFKITKSDNFKWQEDYLTYLSQFNETVTLEKGIYHFYKGYIYSGNEEKFPTEEEILKGQTKMLFGSYTKRLPSFVAVDETKGEAGKVVNYITETPLTGPIILVDGKEAGYKITDKGFKLDNTIYPKHANIKIYTREEAVKNFNESARDKGLIVITTGPEKEQ